MKKNNPARPIFLWMTFFFGLLPASTSMAETHYQEQGKKNLSGSWLSDELNHQWGLAAIGAHYAYARGYTGLGINVGVLDEAVTPHIEFSNKLQRLTPDDPWNYDENADTGVISFGAHGNHVAGIIAANRDGNEMHGVAFEAGLITGKYLQTPYNRTEAMIQSNARVINNSWGVRPHYETDANGRPKRWENGTIKYYPVTLQDVINYVTLIKDDLDRLSRSPIPEVDDYTTRSAGLLRAARQGKLVVFAAGNANNYNVTWLHAGMPYFFPDVLNNYLSVANLTRENKINVSSTSCGYTASYCLSAPGTKIYSSTGDFFSKVDGYINEEALQKEELGITQSYDTYTGTSMAAPHVTGAAAVLMQRFPYMTAGQIADVLKTTATDLGDPGIDEMYGWGMLNLKDAIDGPKMFITEQDIPKQYYIPGSYTDTQFIANIPGIGSFVEKDTTVERVCNSRECAYDSWNNDISGHGGLTKIGNGILELASKNSTYKGPTLVEQGRLQVSGTITSDVMVQDGATLGGAGTVGSIMLNTGASVEPGNLLLADFMGDNPSLSTSGTLNVDRNITFLAGSRYLVEVVSGNQNHSDRIVSNGLATLKGGEVQVSLENSDNLLSKQEVRSLLGQQYNILQANRGINGQFSTVVPNYLFVGADLRYDPDRVMLDIKRNSTAFSNFAITTNERAVANAADQLSLGHPVHESILMLDTTDQARQAFQQLATGQIHADIVAAQIDNSRYLRDTLNTRLRQADVDGVTVGHNIKADRNGAWAQITGNWQRAEGNSEVNGYRVSNYGVLLGADKALDNDWRLGVATGYIRSSLNGGYNTSARSNNFHLALYGSKQIEAFALRAGVAYSWHRFDTQRSVVFGHQSDNLNAKYSAQTGQLFTEAAYGMDTPWLNLEPFVNLSQVNFRHDGIHEHGGAAALSSKKQSKNATYSTLGLRINQEWQTENDMTVGAYGELGWQHQFGNINRTTQLRFSDSHTTLTLNSVSAARDAAVIKAGTTWGINENTRLSLGYNGVLSGNHKDNGVFLNANWQF